MELTFFLKKFISFFLEPFGMVATLFVLGLYFLYMNRAKRAKQFLSASFLLLFLFSYPPFTNTLVENLENQYPKYDYKTEVEYVHVLGNGHNTDKSQPISSHLNDTQTKRVLEGIIIYKHTPNSKLIFTGYSGSTDISNAKMNAILSSALGVEDEAMIINGNPVDTREEAAFTKTIVGDSPFVLVTSATHMPRAMIIFRSFGMNPIAAPTNYYKEDFRGYFRKPSARHFFISTVAVHEYLGMVLAIIRSNI